MSPVVVPDVRTASRNTRTTATTTITRRRRTPPSWATSSLRTPAAGSPNIAAYRANSARMHRMMPF
jgi:hypothetical protein